MKITYKKDVVLDKRQFKHIKKRKVLINNVKTTYYYSPKFRADYLDRMNFDLRGNIPLQLSKNHKYDIYGATQLVNPWQLFKIYNFLKYKYYKTKEDFYLNHLIIARDNLFKSYYVFVKYLINDYYSHLLPSNTYYRELIISKAEDIFIKTLDEYCPFYKVKYTTFLIRALVNALQSGRTNYNKRIMAEKEISQEILNKKAIKIIYNPDNFDSEETLKEVNEMLKNSFNFLTPRQKEVIIKRFGFSGQEQTLQEIGDEYNVSKERIRQIQNQALAKIKRNLDKTVYDDGCDFIIKRKQDTLDPVKF